MQAHKPPICMTQGLLKQWLSKYGKAAAAHDASSSSGSAAVRISSRAELEEKFGNVLHTIADANPTPFRFCGAMQKRSPPVYVTPGVAKEWFKKVKLVVPDDYPGNKLGICQYLISHFQTSV